MKIWIGTDMEGIAGVVDREHTHREGREHDRARGWMTDEVNAAVAGCFEGGATAVTVTDGHGTCRAGLHPGVLDHTSWSQTVAEVRLNARPVGEVELNAAYAGELGVPVLLVSGDDVLAADLVQSLPQVRAVVVKRALGRFQAESEHPSVVCARLQQAAREAVTAAAAVRPYVVDRPVTLDLQFHHPMYTDLAAMVPGCRKTGAWTAAFTGDSFMAAFGAFTAMCGVTGIAHYQHR
ncbi:MAG: M55 family metallopeptidase [Armatimonadota bacterium]